MFYQFPKFTEFVGNICRSPLAEAVFLKQINEKGIADKFHVDSAAVGAWHVGKKPGR